MTTYQQLTTQAPAIVARDATSAAYFPAAHSFMLSTRTVDLVVRDTEAGPVGTVNGTNIYGPTVLASYMDTLN